MDKKTCDCRLCRSLQFLPQRSKPAPRRRSCKGQRLLKLFVEKSERRRAKSNEHHAEESD